MKKNRYFKKDIFVLLNEFFRVEFLDALKIEMKISCLEACKFG
jgi:hypothetical protein